MPSRSASLRARMLALERDSARLTGVVLHPLATDAFVVRLVVRDFFAGMRRLNPEAVGWDLVMDRLCRDLVAELRPASAVWLLDEVVLNFFPQHEGHAGVGHAVMDSERALDLGVVAALASSRLNTHLQTILGTLFSAPAPHTQTRNPHGDPLEAFRAAELRVRARATRLPPRQVFYYNLWRVVHEGAHRVARLWAAMNGQYPHGPAAPQPCRTDALVASLGGRDAYVRLVPAVFRLGRVVKMLDAARGDVLLVTVDFAEAQGDAHWHVKKLLEAQSPAAAVDGVQQRAAAVQSLDARYMRQDVFVPRGP